MSDTVALALIAAGVTLTMFVGNRLMQLRTARNAERVKSDDDPGNDDAYDPLAEDLASDTGPKT